MFSGQDSIAVCTVVTISIKQEFSFNEYPKNMVNFTYWDLSFLIFVNLPETMMGGKKP